MSRLDQILGNKPNTALNQDIQSNETIPIESLSESQREEIVEKSKGLTTAQKVMLGLDAAALGLLVTPAPGARIAAGATKLLSLGIRGASWAKKTYDAARARRLFKAGQRELKRRGGVPPTTPYNPNMPLEVLKTVPEIGRQALRKELVPKIVGGTTLTGATYALMDPKSPLALFPDENLENDKDNPPPTKGLTQEFLENIKADVDEPTRGGLGGQMDYRDMIRLGVGVMGAKDMSELGESVTGILDAQDKRELLGLQGKFTQAQTEQIQAKIESMELEQLQATASILYKGISDGSLDRETNEPILQQYLEQIQKLQNVELLGSKALSDAEQKILEQSKAIV